MVSTVLFPTPVVVRPATITSYGAPPTPVPPPLTPAETEAIERDKLLRAVALPAAGCATLGGAAGAALGYQGGLLGAVAGLAASGAGTVAGGALGGYLGMKAGVALLGKYDLLGFLGTIATTTIGATVGAAAGFYAGAAVGAAAGTTGGTLGAVAGAVGIGTLAGGFGALGVAIHEVTSKPHVYPNLHEALKSSS